MGTLTLSDISAATEHAAPEFARTEQIYQMFGIKRGTLYNLHRAGLIKGKVLRVRGNLTGVRLWDVQSIRGYINSQPDTWVTLP